MRVARYFPLVVLTGFLCEAAIPLTACASDSAAVAANGESSNLRPSPNATTITSEGDPTSDRNGPLFRGEPLSFPKLPFGRHKPTYRPPTHSSKPSSNQTKPTIFGQMRQQMGSQTAAAGRPMQQQQQRTMSAAPSTARNNGTSQNARTAANRPQQSVRQATAPNVTPLAARQTPPAPANKNTTSVSPWTTPPPATAAAANVVAESPKLAVASSPADKLVAQAHEWSTTAKTDQDYSRIIETCRRAQASQAGPEAIKYANKLTAWAFNRRGQLKAEAGRDKDAILDFDDAIRADATCWRAVHNRGVLHAQAGQFAKAFDDFARTIELEPQYAKAHSNRAALFMVANNLNAAQQDYYRAIELDPNLAVAHRGCGRVCQLLGQLDEAAGHYDAAVQLAPTDAYAAACRADLLTDVGRYSDALSEYNRAIQIDPKSSQAHCGSAWLLATCPDTALRNPALAIERARQSVELGGQKDALSFDSLAAAQASSGDFTAAMESIRKAIELAPADERDAYKGRLALYQKAKPYRIAPVERVAQQASYQKNTK